MGSIAAAGLALVGVVGILGAPTTAQVAPLDAEAVSVLGGGPLEGSSVAPSASSDGDVVAFTNSGGTSFEHAVVVRDRSSSTSLIFDTGTAPSTAAVSGDGCIVAYIVAVDVPPPTTTTTTTTTTTDPPVTDPPVTDPPVTDPPVTDPPVTDPPVTDPPVTDPTVTDPVNGSGVSGPLGVRQQLQAPTTGAEVRVFDRCVSEAQAVLPVVIDTIDDVDGPLGAPALSDDGDVVVVSTGTGVRVYSAVLSGTPIDETVDGADAGDVTGPRVDVSSDGETVVFSSTASTPDAEPAVFVWTANDGAAAVSDPPTGAATWPTISGDGSLVAYETRLDGGDPEIRLHDRTADTTIDLTSGRRPVLSTDGGSIAYDFGGAVRVRRSDSTVPFEDSTEKIVSSAVTGIFESVGESVSGATLSADGEFVVFDSPAGVPLTSDDRFADAGHVWLRSTDPIFTPPTTIAPTAPPTVATTAPLPTFPPTTRVANTIPPRTTTRPTVPRTTRATTTTTTTSTLPLPVLFDPAAFEFAPTIVDAGRRTAELALVNPSASAVTVIAVEVEAATGSPFEVIDSTCGGSLPAGSQCMVTVAFAPTEAGEATGNVVARFADDTTATSALRGLGASAPVLDVRPSVASNGQVVSVFGFGFPAGGIVELMWQDGLVRRDVVVDERGEFVESLVVLPNTRRGPTELKVTGQTDSFGDTIAELLIGDTTDSPAVFSRSLGG